MKIAVFGLGEIGQTALSWLKKSYDAEGFDLTNGYDLSDQTVLNTILKDKDIAVVCTPHFLNYNIAAACLINKCAYFDLTEDTVVAKKIEEQIGRFSDSRPIVPCCGLAPGIVSIIANRMAVTLKTVKDIEIRVGALPQYPTNTMGYNLAWNTRGLINEYIYPCPALVNNELTNLQPLEGLETCIVNGKTLEAFNTAGGLGTLAESWMNRAQNVNYKTLRYPGHAYLMQFLLRDLNMKANAETFIELFDKEVPRTKSDVVFIQIRVNGINHANQLATYCYDKEILSEQKNTAIQIATVSGLLSVVDAYINNPNYFGTGFIKVEDIEYTIIEHSQYFGVFKHE